MKKKNVSERNGSWRKTIIAITASLVACMAITVIIWSQGIKEQKARQFSKLMEKIEGFEELPNGVQIEIIKDFKNPQIKKCTKISELKDWKDFQWIEVEVPSCELFDKQIYLSISRDNKKEIEAYLNLHEKGAEINSGKSCKYGYGITRLIPDPGFDPNSSGAEAYSYMLNTPPPPSPSPKELKQLQLEAIQAAITTIENSSSQIQKF